MRHRTVRLLAVWIACALHMVLGQSVTFQYGFDPAGQLTRIVDSTGVSIEYIYDPAGNITEIKRTTIADPSALSIFSFAPPSGGPGSVVTLQGQNFNPTPANNAVRFNGVLATVTQATATTLTVVVPNNATSGAISVATGGMTATSATNFSVLALPLITSVLPKFLLTGQTNANVQVTGINLGGSTFGFSPFFSPPAAVATSATIGGGGTTASLMVSTAQSTATLALVATNGAGPSSSVPALTNSLTVLDPALDGDGDGLSNAEELAAGTDPLRVDTDGDGMRDDFEVRNGLDPLNPNDAGLDSDGDGRTNLEEALAGTDPQNPDVVPPQVSSVVPNNGAGNHAPNAAIVVTMNEPILPTSVVTGSVRVLESGADLGGSLSLSPDGMVVTFAPTIELTPLTPHTIRVEGLRDIAGNPMASVFQSSFTTSDIVDTTRPTVTRVSPGNGATDAPINITYFVEFSERIDLGTLTAATFYLYDSVTGQNIAGRVQADITGRSAQFIPDAPLPVGRRIFAYLTNNIQDVAGNRLGFSSYSFTTGFDQDTTGPSLLSRSPEDMDAGIPVNVEITLAFDEPVNQVNFLRGTRILFNGTDVPGAFVFSDGDRVVRFNEAQPFQPGIHSIQVSPQVTDLVGNPLANPGTTTFTVDTPADNTNPTLLSANPPASATNVGRNVIPKMTFSERMIRSSFNTSNSYIYENNTGEVVPAQIVVSQDRRTLSFLPEQTLKANTAYRFHSSGPRDLAGRTFSNSVYFVTGSGVDTTPPLITGISPTTGASSVPVNAIVDVRFDEPLNPDSVTNRAITLMASGSPVPGTTVLSNDRQGLTFTPTALLGVNTTYAVQVSGFTDLAGNVFSPAGITFNTGAQPGADTSRPIILQFDPVNGSANVPLSKVISVTFSKPVNPNSVHDGTFHVRLQSTGAHVGGTYSVDGPVVTFSPFGNLPGNSSLITWVSGVKDYADNTNQFAQSVWTTQVGQDSTAPTVTSVTPAQGESNMGLNTVVSLVFSESLDPSSVNGNTVSLFSGVTRLSTSVSRSSDNKSVTLSASLPAASTISVVVTSEVKDLSGNAAVDFVSSFTTVPSYDGTRPSVVGQRPGNGGSSVPVDNPVVLFISEPMDAASVASALRISENGVLVNGATDVAGNGQIVNFTPDAPFQTGSLVQIFLGSQARDLAGNPLNAFAGSFTTAPDLTGTLPTPVRTLPGNSNSITTNPVIEVEYNKPLDPATVNIVNVVLRLSANSQIVPASVSLRNDRIIRIVPTSQLLPNMGYSYQITTALKDAEGLSPNSIYQRFFTTGSGPDLGRPRVASVTPPDSVLGVGVNAPIRVVFTETINPMTVNASTISVHHSGGVQVPHTTTFANNDTEVTLTPLLSLPDATEIYIDIANVEDRSGNLVVAENASFETRVGPDLDRVSVLRTTPFASAPDVPTNAVVALELSEPIDPSTLSPSSVSLYDGFLGSEVPGEYSVSPNGLKLTFVPDEPFPVGRIFTLYYNQNLRDISGNFLIGGSFNFTVAFAQDTTPPTLLLSNPVDGLAGVPINAEIQLRFDEPIQSLSVADVNLRMGGVVIPVTRVLSNGNRDLALIPDTLFTPAQNYSIGISGVSDLAGNSLASIAPRTFTTGPGGDLIRPTVIAVNPASGSTEAPRNVMPSVLLSERVNPLTVDPSTFRLYNNNSGLYIDADIVLSADGRTATLIPEEQLDANTSYSTYVSGFTDVVGGAVSTSFSFTTGAAPDTTGPTVLSVTPPHNAPAVPVNSQVSVLLDEPVDILTVDTADFVVTRGGNPVPGSLDVSSDRMILTFTPAAAFASNQTFNVSVQGFTDRAGNFATPLVSSFTTSAIEDTARPVIQTFVPANGSANVPVNSTVIVTFSEAVNPITVSTDSVQIYVQSTGARVAGGYTTNGSIVTFTPLAPLPGNVDIVTRVSGVEDYAGNSNNFAQAIWTTSAVSDVTPPAVLSVSPEDGAVDMGLSTKVVLVFSESLDPSTVNSNTLSLFEGLTKLSTSVSRSSDNRTVTLSRSLPASTLLTVVATDGVKDLSGNSLPTFTSSFTTTAVDTSRPSVTSIRPANGSSNVPAASPVTVFVNEELNAASVNAGIHVSQNGTLIAGSIQVTSNNRVIRFTPAVPFAAGTRIQVFLDSNITDGAGNELHNYAGSFTVEPDLTTTPPSVVRTIPGGTSSVPINPAIQIEYNKALNPSTVNATNVVLRRSDNNAVVPSTVSLIGDRVIKIAPASQLLPSTGYRYEVTTALSDTTGLAPSSHYQAFFNTGVSADSAAPTLSSVTPPNQSVDVGISAAVKLIFSEPVNPISIRAGTTSVTPNGGTALSASFTFSDSNRVVTLAPLGPLPDLKEIAVAVAGVEDRSGNPVNFNSVFTTGVGPDSTRPAVVATNPFPSAVDVPVNSIVTLSTSEAVDPATVSESTFYIYPQGSGVQVPGSFSVSGNGRELTFVPNAPWASATRYNVYYSSGIQDLSANALLGSSFYFTTSSAGDTTPPQVSGTNPAAGDTQVPRNAAVQVDFNEPVQLQTLTGITLSSGGNPIPVTVEAFNGNQSVRLTPTQLLAPSTTHTVSIAGVRDIAGNVIASPVTLNFTTGAVVDTLIPVITASNPSNGQSGVGVGGNLTLTFSEKINPLTVRLGDTVRLYPSSTGEDVAGAISVSADRLTVTINPTNNLSPGTSYRIWVSGVEDLAQNSNQFYNSLFTTQ